MTTPIEPVLLAPGSFRQAIEQVNSLRLRWEEPHPVHEWLDAAERLACELERGLDVGDPALPPSRDPAFQAYAENVVVPATRLCRLSRSLGSVALLGPAAAEEIRGLAQRDHFRHSDFVLFVGTRLARLTGKVVRVVRQGRSAGPTPDLEVEEDQACIECRARGDVGRAPSDDLRDDFGHATRKFDNYLRDRPAWLGVLAVDMAFIGSPTLPDLGRAGPGHQATTDDAMANFGFNPNVSAFLNTWFTVEARRHRGARRKYDLEPSNASGLLYSPNCERRIASLDYCFYPWKLGSRRTALRRTDTKK